MELDSRPIVLGYFTATLDIRESGEFLYILSYFDITLWQERFDSAALVPDCKLRPQLFLAIEPLLYSCP